jgi:hypothetical protein
MYGIQPGGPGGPGGGDPDANTIVDANDGGTTGAILHGIACLITDLRTLGPCAPSGAGGLVVKLGSQVATTSDNGTFAIPAPVATNLTWLVSGGAFETSIVSFNAFADIPVITTTTFGDLELDNGILEVAGQGALVTHVVHGGAFVAGATATTTPSAAYAPLYDGATATAWNQNSTSTHGAIWIAGLATGTASLTVTASSGGPQIVSGIPIGDGTITFVTVEIP